MIDLFCGSWILLLPIMAILGVGFIFLRRRKNSLAKWSNWIGLLMLGFLIMPIPILGGMFLYMYGVILPQEHKQITQDSDSIIKNLTKFKINTGRYPNELSELEPDYLKSIPILPSGRPYVYKQLGDEYTLQYPIPYSNPYSGFTYCTYSSKNQTTRCRD